MIVETAVPIKEGRMIEAGLVAEYSVRRESTVVGKI